MWPQQPYAVVLTDTLLRCWQVMDAYGNLYDDPLPARYRVYLSRKASSDGGGSSSSDGSGRVYAQLDNYDVDEQAYK